MFYLRVMSVNSVMKIGMLNWKGGWVGVCSMLVCCIWYYWWW